MQIYLSVVKNSPFGFNSGSEFQIEFEREADEVAMKLIPNAGYNLRRAVQGFSSV